MNRERGLISNFDSEGRGPLERGLYRGGLKRALTASL